MAVDDPVKQVIEPLKELYKLAAPYEKAGVLIPPGPSVIGTATGTGVQINIYLGSIVRFENVVIDSVSAEIDTRLSRSSNSDHDKKLLHAKVDVSFTSFYTFTRDDVDLMFNTKQLPGGE
jgi:hypothetical protein